MEVTLICECEECSSTLIELGCLNILCDIPKKLLSDFSNSLKGSLACEFGASCDLYDRLKCSEIHLILITSARGLEGLDLLSHFYDLSSTHIVCTRPVYVFGTIYYLNYNYDSKNKTKSEDKCKGFRTSRFISNLKEPEYKDEFSLEDFFNNNLLKLISYNEVVKINATTSSVSYPESKREQLEKRDYLNDVNVVVELVGLSSGYSLGSCNYVIKHQNIKERIVVISKSSDYKRYTKPFNYSIFENLNKNDIVILLSNSQKNNSNQYNQENLKKIKDEYKKENKEVQLKKEDDNLFENEDKMDVDEELDKENIDLKEEEIDKYVMYCIDSICKGNNIIIPVDPNYEYLVDLLENINKNIKKMRRQAYVYCVGKGIEDLFDHLEKCCEWVRRERSELTMHSEEPKSPFPEIEEMRNNNQLFLSENINGIKNIYKVPAILILVLHNENDVLNYVNRDNTKFLILQNKFVKYFKAEDGEYNNNNNNNNNNSNNSNSKYLVGKIEYEMDFSNINVENRVIDLRRESSSGTRTVEVNVDEECVGYVTGKVKESNWNSLKFKDFCKDLKVNKFEINHENINQVILTEKEGKTSGKQKSQKAKDDKNEDIEELMMFGEYKYQELVAELNTHFKEAQIQVIKKPEKDLVILTSSNMFNIVINESSKTTMIETSDYTNRKLILKSIQNLLISI